MLGHFRNAISPLAAASRQKSRIFRGAVFPAAILRRVAGMATSVAHQNENEEVFKDFTGFDRSNVACRQCRVALLRIKGGSHSDHPTQVVNDRCTTKTGQGKRCCHPYITGCCLLPYSQDHTSEMPKKAESGHCPHCFIGFFLPPLGEEKDENDAE